ncbi:MAG: glutamine synthetase type III, partial [Acutalibacter sp.]|nr:glutamine synthetase type III [Acutalibacter sp.]
FAFTGNKFEFRSLGSAISIACPNIMLNTMVAEELRQFADELESAEDLKSAVTELVRRVMKEHKRIIFNGDGYSEEWVKEAERRGLLNLRTTVDALPRYLDKKNIDLFTSHKIYTEAEMTARYETILEEYVKTLHIEAVTFISMARHKVIPAVSGYLRDLAGAVSAKREILKDLPCTAETDLLQKLSALLDEAYAQTETLNAALDVPEAADPDVLKAAAYYRDHVIPVMETLRATVDKLEENVSAERWPYPTYAELMFNV